MNHPRHQQDVFHNVNNNDTMTVGTGTNTNLIDNSNNGHTITTIHHQTTLQNQDTTQNIMHTNDRQYHHQQHQQLQQQHQQQQHLPKQQLQSNHHTILSYGEIVNDTLLNTVLPGLPNGSSATATTDADPNIITKFELRGVAQKLIKQYRLKRSNRRSITCPPQHLQDQYAQYFPPFHPLHHSPTTTLRSE
eukprot:UN00387